MTDTVSFLAEVVALPDAPEGYFYFWHGVHYIGTGRGWTLAEKWGEPWHTRREKRRYWAAYDSMDPNMGQPEWHPVDSPASYESRSYQKALKKGER